MKSLSLIILFLGLIVTSCVKEYTHQKIVVNNTRHNIEVVSGCCGQINSYTIEPNTSKVVFICTYQGARPDEGDLSWNFIMKDHEGNVTDLSIPSLWDFEEAERELNYTFVAK